MTLVGDAAYCPSLLTGEGSGFAMAGAYLLAGELARADGDYRRACTAYESRFRPFVLGKQKKAQHFAGQFAPMTDSGAREDSNVHARRASKSLGARALCIGAEF